MKKFFVIILGISMLLFACTPESKNTSSGDSEVKNPINVSNDSVEVISHTETFEKGLLDSACNRITFSEFTSFIPDEVDGNLSSFSLHFKEPVVNENVKRFPSNNGWFWYEESRSNYSFLGFGGSANKKLGVPLGFDKQYVEGKFINNKPVGRWIHYLYDEGSALIIPYAVYEFNYDISSENSRHCLTSLSFYALNDSARILMNKEDKLLYRLLTNTNNLHFGLIIDSIIYYGGGIVSEYRYREYEEVYNKFDNSGYYRRELDCVANYSYRVNENGDLIRNGKGFQIDNYGNKIIDNYDEKGFSPITVWKSYYCLTISHLRVCSTGYGCGSETESKIKDKRIKSQFNESELIRNDKVIFNAFHKYKSKVFDFYYASHNPYSRYYHTHSIDEIYKDILLKLYYKLECAYKKSNGRYLPISEYSNCEIDFFSPELEDNRVFYPDYNLNLNYSTARNEIYNVQSSHFGHFYYLVKGNEIAVFNDY